MALSSEEGPQLAHASRALNAMRAKRWEIRAKNIGLLDLIKGKSTLKHETEHVRLNNSSSNTNIHLRQRGSLGSKDKLKTKSPAPPFPMASRSEAEVGVIVVKSPETHPKTQTDELALTPLTPCLKPAPPPVPRRHYTSVRLHQDVVGGGKVALELILHDSSSPKNPPPVNLLPGNDEKIRHLNVVSDVMDFQEFRVIALTEGNLIHSQLEVNLKLAISTVLRSAENAADEGNGIWYIQPGTLLRCDVDHHGTIVASATFISIPYIRNGSGQESSNISDRRGVCVPRRLDKTLLDPSYSSVENEASFTKEDLWVDQAWMLIVNDNKILTYGGKPCQDSAMNNIETKMFAANTRNQRMVHVTEQNGLQFEIPLAECSSLLTMEASLQYQLEQMKPRTDPDDCAIAAEEPEEFNFLRRNGGPMTSVAWSHLLHAGYPPVVQVKLEQKPPGSDDSKPDPMGIYNSYGRPELVGHQVSEHTAKWVRQHALNEHAPQSIGSSFEDVDFAQVASSISDDTDGDSEFDSLELDAASPHIFTWGLTDENRDDTRIGINGRIEYAYKYFDWLSFNGLLDRQEDVLGVATGSTRCSLDMFKREIDRLMDRLSNVNGHNDGRFRDQTLLLDYYDFCKAATRFLEAFIPNNCSTSGLHKLFNALYKGFMAPEFLTMTRSHANYMILYRTESANSLGSRTRSKYLCQDCLNKTIYTNLADVFAHLRACHYTELPPGDMIDRHVTELLTAAEKAQTEWNGRIVRQGRDLTAKLAHEAGEIRSLAAYADLVNHPSWKILDVINPPLGKSFVQAVSSMFSLSHALDGTAKFYHVSVYEVERDNLELGLRPVHLVGVMDKSGVKALEKLKKVQVHLAAEINKVQSQDLVKLFAPVGVHELAAQMVGNLLTAPVHVSLSPEAVEPYLMVQQWKQQLLKKMRLLARSRNTLNARAIFAQANRFHLDEYILEEAENRLRHLPRRIASRFQDAHGRRLQIIPSLFGVAGDQNLLGLIYGIFLFGNSFYFLRHILGPMHPIPSWKWATPLAMTPAIVSGLECIGVFLMAIALPWYYMEWFGTDDDESI
ncbi:unnamed protein product [Clonostachys byssicola]|uniref:Uncharacterized protein n=1 Tax=Clonostachys byssicola TaxID=160290 RepID=A0A9N9UHW2_9HYPO|nr:unnamed protein product [Clonostachys byssicola]